LVLFVGTRRPFARIIENSAVSCKSFFVTQRWLGGTLTNWSTIRTCLRKLKLFCVILNKCYLFYLYKTFNRLNNFFLYTIAVRG
jgi:ribosomal protein S2